MLRDDDLTQLKSARHPLWTLLAWGLFSLVALHQFPLPFAWAAFGGVVAMVVLAVTASSSGWKALWVNLAVLCATVCGVELWANGIVKEQRQTAATYAPANYYLRGKLGLAPVPSSAIHSTRQRDGRKVYDVTYHYTPTGVRVTPPDSASGVDGCVLFFGDSFILGEGLHDSSTTPAQLALQSGGRYRTFNFGFHGYGPQQMLAALETGITDSVATCRPTHIVFETIWEHVARVAGLNTWSGSHPRYVLQPDGSVQYGGLYADVRPKPSPAMAQVTEQLRKSALYSMMTARHRPVNDADVALYLGVVKQAHEIAERKYPGIDFEVLLFNRGNPAQDSMLQTIGLKSHIVEQLIHGYFSDTMAYTIPGDGHPSALADSLIARYLIDSVLTPKAQ